MPRFYSKSGRYHSIKHDHFTWEQSLNWTSTTSMVDVGSFSLPPTTTTTTTSLPQFAPNCQAQDHQCPSLSWGMWAHSMEDNTGGKSNQRGGTQESGRPTRCVFFLPLFSATPTLPPSSQHQCSQVTVTMQPGRQWHNQENNNNNDDDDVMTTATVNQDGDEGTARMATMMKWRPQHNNSTVMPRWNPTTRAKDQTRTAGELTPGWPKQQQGRRTDNRAGDMTARQATWQWGGQHDNRVGNMTAGQATWQPGACQCPWNNNTNHPTTTWMANR